MLSQGDGFLHKYFLNNSSKVLHKWLHYFDIYERHFEKYRGKHPVMLEIGVSGGGSLEMWQSYFGEGCKIIGVDINPDCVVHEGHNIEVFIGSQDDPSLVERIFTKYRNIDIVLDNGSHWMKHMVASFELLYNRINANGVYMVEDTHTCYWNDPPEIGGGFKRKGSFMEYVKDRLDDINACHSRGALPISTFTKTTDMIAVYDSIVVFEKRPQARRQMPVTQAM